MEKGKSSKNKNDVPLVYSCFFFFFFFYNTSATTARIEWAVTSRKKAGRQSRQRNNRINV